VGDVATWVGSLAALATAVSAVIIASRLRRGERRQALVDLHVSLTTGETAHARNVMGTLLLSGSETTRPSKLEAIDAYFRLIWSVQRARNVFRIHKFHWTSIELPEGVKPSSMQQEAERALSWNLREIAENVVEFHDRYCASWDVEDRDAWEEMADYLSSKSGLRRST